MILKLSEVETNFFTFLDLYFDKLFEKKSFFLKMGKSNSVSFELDDVHFFEENSLKPNKMIEISHNKNFSLGFVDVFKESFVKVCTESTSHGLPNIFKTDNWIIKIFWLCLFMGGSGAALYCTYISI